MKRKREAGGGVSELREKVRERGRGRNGDDAP